MNKELKKWISNSGLDRTSIFHYRRNEVLLCYLESLTKQRNLTQEKINSLVREYLSNYEPTN